MLFVTCEKKNNLRWSGRPRMGFMYPSRPMLTLSLRRWKFFVGLIFVVVGHRRNIFDNENFRSTVATMQHFSLLSCMLPLEVPLWPWSFLLVLHSDNTWQLHTLQSSYICDITDLHNDFQQCAATSHATLYKGLPPPHWKQCKLEVWEVGNEATHLLKYAVQSDFWIPCIKST